MLLIVTYECRSDTGMLHYISDVHSTDRAPIRLKRNHSLSLQIFIGILMARFGVPKLHYPAL